MAEHAFAPLLDVAGLSLRFGGIGVLEDVSFDVAPQTFCSLIGPNGAGKTSLFNCVSRFYQPQAGRIAVCGVDVLEVPAHGLARLGVSRTFQELALFPSLSVFDNVLLGTHVTTGSGLLRGALRTPGARSVERLARRRCGDVLDLVGLADVADRPAAGLSYGVQKRVELARALAGRPRLLLLDEPASGLTGPEVAAFAQQLRGIREQLDLTILMIEHHMAMVMQVSGQVVVLDSGRVIANGPPQQIQADPAVVEAYLGAPA